MCHDSCGRITCLWQRILVMAYSCVSVQRCKCIQPWRFFCLTLKLSERILSVRLGFLRSGGIFYNTVLDSEVSRPSKNFLSFAAYSTTLCWVKWKLETRFSLLGVAHPGERTPFGLVVHGKKLRWLRPELLDPAQRTESSWKNGVVTAAPSPSTWHTTGVGIGGPATMEAG